MDVSHCAPGSYCVSYQKALQPFGFSEQFRPSRWPVVVEHKPTDLFPHRFQRLVNISVSPVPLPCGVPEYYLYGNTGSDTILPAIVPDYRNQRSPRGPGALQIESDCHC